MIPLRLELEQELRALAARLALPQPESGPFLRFLKPLREAGILSEEDTAEIKRLVHSTDGKTGDAVDEAALARVIATVRGKAAP